MTATPAVHAVKPIHPTLEDEGLYKLETYCGFSQIEWNGNALDNATLCRRLNGYLADCDMLRDWLRAEMREHHQTKEDMAMKNLRIQELILALRALVATPRTRENEAAMRQALVALRAMPEAPKTL